jgi:hypothetical protein
MIRIATMLLVLLLASPAWGDIKDYTITWELYNRDSGPELMVVAVHKVTKKEYCETIPYRGNIKDTAAITTLIATRLALLEKSDAEIAAEKLNPKVNLDKEMVEMWLKQEGFTPLSAKEVPK